MRIIALFFVVIGVALAGGAAFFASQHFKRLEAMMATQDTGPEVVRVIAANKMLKYGDRITEGNKRTVLRWVEWPKSAVPAGAFTTAEGLMGPSVDESRTVLRTIEPGELILQSKVTGFGQDVRVATRVAEGKRAFTIPINVVSGVAGLIAPGDRVDIMLTRKIARELTTSVILQHVLVIATDQTSSTESNRTRVARTATVEVDPTEASKLALAQQVGKLTLSLRGRNEDTDTAIQPVRLQDLPDQPEAIAPTAAPQRTTVKVRKGGEVQEIAVD